MKGRSIFVSVTYEIHTELPEDAPEAQLWEEIEVALNEHNAVEIDREIIT